MKRSVTMLALALMMTSCSAGGGGVSGSGAKIQYLWSTVGVDKYEAVVYPENQETPPNGIIFD